MKKITLFASIATALLSCAPKEQPIEAPATIDFREMYVFPYKVLTDSATEFYNDTVIQPRQLIFDSVTKGYVTTIPLIQDTTVKDNRTPKPVETK